MLLWRYPGYFKFYLLRSLPLHVYLVTVLIKLYILCLNVILFVHLPSISDGVSVHISVSAPFVCLLAMVQMYIVVSIFILFLSICAYVQLLLITVH